MGLLNSLHLKLALLVTTTAAALAAATEAHTNPVCNYTCGNVSIPYPFGTSEKCCRDEKFFLNCTTVTSPSSGEATKQLISGDNIPVLNISLDPPELIVSGGVTKHCYNSTDDSYLNTMEFVNFSISNNKNRITVVGCDTFALITDLEGTFTTGCVSSCSKETRFKEGACSGVGCCETCFPEAIRNYNMTLSSFNNYTKVHDFNRCGYAFVAKDTFQLNYY
ncbi:hypothetical protein QN277_026729 [Acacia crassicarpa]|uniref:Wall-associated receptor kinase galacturonan-binding domain-containing protein n=1 Tax=Acacia crassicarpa TaxID=499986 RepID=A0AAE1JBG2_9FABA|nr:hypothetical protein QN277_026729 [Acacia crassicarpa]